MNTQENKTAIFALPSAQTTIQTLKDNAPTGIAIGAGTAGLVNLLAELRRNRQQQVTKNNSDVLEVQIPTAAAQQSKTAEANRPGLWANIRAKKNRGEKPAKPGQEGYPDKENWNKLTSESKSAAMLPSGIGSPIISALKNIIENPAPAIRAAIPITAGAGVGGAALWNGIKNTSQTPTPTSNFWQAPLELGALAIPAVASYAGVNSLMSSIREKREQQRLESAKQQYAKLLGDQLTEPKTASFPLCEEVVRVLSGAAAADFNVSVGGTTKLADFNASERAVALGLSVPSMLAVLAGVTSHKYMYDREQAAIAGAKMTPTRIKPPSQIRLVSVPAQPVEQKEQEAGDLPAEAATKTAAGYNPITAAAADLAMGSFLINKAKEGNGGKGDEPKINPQTGMPFVKKLQAQPKDNFVDSNTLVVNTPTGNTVIEAVDPTALKILQEKQKDLAQRMEAASVLPTDSTNF